MSYVRGTSQNHTPHHTFCFHFPPTSPIGRAFSRRVEAENRTHEKHANQCNLFSPGTSWKRSAVNLILVVRDRNWSRGYQLLQSVRQSSRHTLTDRPGTLSGDGRIYTHTHTHTCIWRRFESLFDLLSVPTKFIAIIGNVCSTGLSLTMQRIGWLVSW